MVKASESPKVAAIVVSHGAGTDLDDCLAALAPQVDELVVVANLPGEPLGQLPPGAKVVANMRPLGLAANVNRAIAETSAPFVVMANPDTRAEPGAVEALRAFMEGRPRCGIAGPQMRYPDGDWQPSRRRFPTVVGTLVRRTPLRLLFPPRERQRSYYLLDERPSEPVESDWMLGAFLLLRREMLDELGGFDEGFRLYGEDIDLCYRAAKAGWERWYVPEAVVHHRHAAVSDRRLLTRHTLWHWRSILRFVRKHPERLRAL
jgi:N-acetylglucosaminyl-diphospho-decaprenol L-rhamnosyltransferase